MELRIYLRMIQRGWWMIALTTLIAVAVALVLSYVAEPMYRASASFVVSPNPTQVQSSDIIYSLDALDKRSIVSTYAEFLNSSSVYDAALKDLQLTREGMKKYTHQAVVLPDANVLQVTVEGPDARLVAALANATGKRAVEQIRRYYQSYEISILDAAAVPDAPFSPQPLRDAALAVVLGLAVGAALAVMREQLRMPVDAYRQRLILDSVSGAFTGRYVRRKVEEEVDSGAEAGFSLGLVRLNGLRDLIDTMPPAVTQRLLRQASGVLRRELRGTDLVGRWSDIAFIVLLPATPRAPAVRTLERIQHALNQPIQIDEYDETIPLQPQVAVVTWDRENSAVELFERLDKAIEGRKG